MTYWVSWENPVSLEVVGGPVLRFIKPFSVRTYKCVGKGYPTPKVSEGEKTRGRVTDVEGLYVLNLSRNGDLWVEGRIRK